MHRRLVISFATIMGAFAFIAVSIAAAAAAHAAVVTAEQAFLEPDDVVPMSIAAHQEEYWEQYLADEGYASARCTKYRSPGDSPYEVPDLHLLAVVIANDGLDWENAYEVYLSPPAGSLIEHEGLLHVFICQPEQGGSLPSSTPPVVETDRVGDTGRTNVALAVAAGAMTAGAAALFLSRRRQWPSADAPPPTASGGA
jgi:hypothetical protein